MNNPASTKQRGRPRAFDKGEALRNALYIFWQRGYEGATMADLSTAIGINKPSIYAAFGNKEALFRQALQKYLAGPAAYIADAMNAPTALMAVERILKDSAELLTNKDNPRGCLIVQGALACGQESDLIRQELISYRKKFEDALTRRFVKAQLDSDLPSHINPAELAKFIATLHQGMSVQAASGATREELLAMIKLALTAWPGRLVQE